jgi:lambda repressor-like predicted transcriptional regulator
LFNSAALTKALDGLRMKKKGSTVPVLSVVSNPSLCVLRGAVLFGLNQKTIASRVMQHTIGIETSEIWRNKFELVLTLTDRIINNK